MAGDAEAAGGPQVEIVAKVRYDPGILLAFILPAALTLVVRFLVEGIGFTLVSSIFYFAFALVVLSSIRYGQYRRAVLQGDGVTVLPRGGGWLSLRPVHFRWDEVLEAHERPFRWMRLRLDRPRKFWTLHRQPRRIVRLPQGIWADPQFFETLRARVPADRVRSEPAFDERLSWSARYWWLLLLVALSCAAAAAACGYFAYPGELLIQLPIYVVLDLMTLLLAVAFCTDRAPGAFKFVAGIIFTFNRLAFISDLLPLYFPHAMPLTTGHWGAFAGALVGAALMVMVGKSYRGWRYAGATLILAAVGFGCGWASCRQVNCVRVGAGGLSYFDPWTPKGDAFLVMEYGSDAETRVCWYSSDAKLARRVALTANAWLMAIGEEAALFRVRSDRNWQLWLVPRHAEKEFIDEAAFSGRGRRTSPDSHYVLVSVTDANGDIIARKICDLETGKVEPVGFSVPLKDSSVIALRNDRTVLWLTGSFPLDKKNERWAPANPPPENGEFPHPGEPFAVWSWKTNSAGPPAQLYLARTQWLEWKQTGKPEQLHVRRVSEKTPRTTEYVLLDFTQSPPAEKMISEQEYNNYRRPSEYAYDGRFEVQYSRGRSPSFVVDTKNHRRFYLPANVVSSIQWSPTANKFLMEVAIPRREGGRWSGSFEWGGEVVVYFVDMDRQ